ncbi:MAG: sodium:proton antiporter, partial [Chlamydiae bacterium]|nr:sodium:proton antiporter [Chlamydiota bacterium]
METKNLILIIVFSISYLAMIFEFIVKINKTAVALCLAVICWILEVTLAQKQYLEERFLELARDVGSIAQIVFFLLAAMTIVEIIDSHKGFERISRCLFHRSKRIMLWTVALATFFISAVLDNLTTTILMISILRKLVPHKKERFVLLCLVVIAANAGGAWTPIGDVTTTMLWIGGQLSTLEILKGLFLPSLVCLIVPCIIYSFSFNGTHELEVREIKQNNPPGSALVFFVGIGSLIAVPIFKWLTGLPPFIGMLFALALVWIVTDWLHHGSEERQHLRVPFVFTKIDVSSLLFFVGILLGIDALQAAGILEALAHGMESYCSSDVAMATSIGLLSSVVDNIPLVAASMGMYNLHEYPMDAHLWKLIAYTAGTGGSILLIGSAS